MKVTDFEFLKKRMQILNGSICKKIGRSCNLIWFHFLVDDELFFINVQSALRFTKHGNILCANLDIYEPKAELLNNPSFSYKTFNWDVQGENYFDEWVKTEGQQLINAAIKQIYVSEFGDLRISFDNDIQLELFNNSLTECWRCFEDDSDNHTVVQGNEIEE